MLEQALVARPHRERRRRASGSASGRRRCSITPRPSSSVDGGIMITGSHNPADYNGFKMVLQRRRLLRRGHPDARPDGGGRRLGARARGAVATSEVMDAMSTGCSQGFDGGAFRIGWDAGNGAAGPALEKLVGAAAGRASPALHRGRRPLSQPPSRSDRRGQSRRSEGAGRGQGPRFRHRLRRRRRPDRRGRRRGPGGLGRPAAGDPRRAGAGGACRARRSSPTSRRARRCSTASPSSAASR